MPTPWTPYEFHLYIHDIDFHAWGWRTSVLHCYSTDFIPNLEN